MATIVNPNFKYKETRKPNKYNLGSEPVNFDNLNTHTMLSVGAYYGNDYSYQKYAIIPQPKPSGVFTPYHG